MHYVAHPRYTDFMAYEVMHMKKVKSRVALYGLIKHDRRDRVPKNADPDRVEDNAYTATTAEAMAKYSELLPEKVRKNAVHAVSVVISASPEWFENASEKDEKAFVNLSRKWLYDLFGRENEVLLAFHKDEKTPHLHAVFVPLVDGKLNAKALIGGTKYRMQQFQDDFHEKVGKPLGMERGEKNTGVHHTEPKEFARVMREEKAKIELQKKALKAEREEFQAERSAFNKELFKAMNEDFKGVFKAHEIHAEDTPLFWKSVFETFARFKAIKKEKAKTEVQTNEVKKSRSR